METKNSNVVYETITLEQWKEAARDIPDLEVQVPTRGNSMYPLLHADKDSVKMVPLNRELKIGDIIYVIRKSGKDIVHRLFWMDEEMVQTIGDNCDKPDGKLPRSHVIGLVTHINRRGREIHVDTKFWRFYGRMMIWTNPFRMFVRNRLYRPVVKLAIRVLKGKK